MNEVLLDELQLIDDLVASLEQNKSNFPAVTTPETKERFFHQVFGPMSENYPDHVLNNLRVLINHHLFNNYVGVDAVVHYLKQRNEYDAKIIEREKTDNFDEKYGTMTGVIESTYAHEDFSSEYELLNCTRTVPSGVQTMQSALEQVQTLNLDFNDYYFMDVGSGMGRNLLIASLFPFKGVVGVEISKGINDIANNNIQLFNPPEQQCSNIKSYAADILDYELPDENMVMFMFEPFSQPIFSKFYARMLDKINEGNHHYVLIFLGEVFQEIKDPNSIFKLVQTGMIEEIAATKYDLHFYSNR
jgi:hypothetical protein